MTKKTEVSQELLKILSESPLKHSKESITLVGISRLSKKKGSFEMALHECKWIELPISQIENVKEKGSIVFEKANYKILEFTVTRPVNADCWFDILSFLIEGVKSISLDKKCGCNDKHSDGNSKSKVGTYGGGCFLCWITGSSAEYCHRLGLCP
jgi:hypothetical protein